MSEYVSKAECEQIRSLYENGNKIITIANRLDRHPSTVDVHVYKRCTHERDSRTHTETTAATITEAIARLAARRSEVPSKNTWENWDERVCTTDTVINRLGSWESAVEAAGLSPVADGAPETIRKVAYQNPEITVTSHE